MAAVGLGALQALRARAASRVRAVRRVLLEPRVQRALRVLLAQVV